MGIQKKQLNATILLLGFVFSFSFSGYTNNPTNPEKSISKASITFIGEKPAEVVIEKIPRKAETIKVNGNTLRYFEGYFYKSEDEVFVRVHAPVGAAVESIPDNYQRIIIAGRIYYYSNGVFYMAKNKKEFEITLGPIGGQFSTLPEGCQNIKINGRSYYLYNDVVFKKGESRSRKYFEVFGYVAS